MDAMIVTYQREDYSTDWFDTTYHTTLCAEGLSTYLHIPRRINQFDAIFTVDQPATDNFFELEIQTGLIGIKSKMSITWVPSARALMQKAWDAGYRFYEVRY